MHRFWLGLHILLAVCLIPGPSWANTSKGTSKPAQKSLTVENVWQHEVQKNRQAMKIKMLRDMGLEPMSVLADEISLKIRKLYNNEINKTKALPTEEAREAREAIHSSVREFKWAIFKMHATMSGYKDNKIGAARARKQMREHQHDMFSVCNGPFGSKIYALLQKEIQKHHNRKQNIIFVRGELGADFKNEYKKALKNPIKAEQILKPFKDILPPAESKDESFKGQFASLFKKEVTPWLPSRNTVKNTSIGVMWYFLLLIATSFMSFAPGGMALTIVTSTVAYSLMAFVTASVLAVYIAVAAAIALAIWSIIALIRTTNKALVETGFETDAFRRRLQTFLKYKLFQEVKGEAHSKPTR